jgi:hypothetical protein
MTISIKANRAYPSLPAVTGDPRSHTRVLEAIREAVEIHERRVPNAYLDSFVRLRELIELGIVQVRGNQIVLSLDTSGGGGGGGGGETPDAIDVDYDNMLSLLTATNVQDAIDEIVNAVGIRGPVASWTPASLTTLLWFDAGDLAQISRGAAGTVSQWADKSGNSWNVTQGTVASRPGYWGLLNGRRVLQFEVTASTRLRLTGILTGLVQNAAGVTMCAVRRFLSVPTTRQWVIGIGTNVVGTTRCGLCAGGTSGKPEVGGRRQDGDSFQALAGATDVTTGWQIQIGVIDYANSDAFLYVDGALDGSTTSFLTSGNTSNTASVEVSIGSSLGASYAEGFSGDIAEVIVIGSVVDTSTRQMIEGYFAHKWGLTASLPNDHPYKSSPPEL